MSRIAVADDHVLLGEVLAAELRSRGHDAYLVDVDDDVVAQLEIETPDVVILDLEFGDDRRAGLRLIEAIVAIGPAVLVVTGVEERHVLGECLQLGAHGIIPKSEGFERLADAIQACCEGRPPPPSDAERVRLMTGYAETLRRRTQALAPFEHLSERECEVLTKLVAGRSVGEISDESFVAISTVRTQVKSILRKLDVSSQLQAVALASSSGWTDASD